MSEIAMTTIGPFRVLCKACNTVAESWYRYGPAPEGATRGLAACECGAVTAAFIGPPGNGRIMTGAAPDQWEVLDPVPPLTPDTPENSAAAEQELPELAAQLGRRIWITDHGIYLVGPHQSDEELISDNVIGARDGLRWRIEMREYRRSLATQGKLLPYPEPLPPQEQRSTPDDDLGW